MNAWKSLTLLTVLALAVARSPASAAADVAEAIPADAIAVVRVTGLHDAWKKFVNSRAWKKLEQAPIPDIANGIRKAKTDLRQFELDTGVLVEKGLASIFGTDMALALFPDKTAAFIARTADKEQLGAAVDTIIAIERNDGKYVGEKAVYHEGVEIRSISLIDPKKPGTPVKKRNHTILNDLLIVSEDLGAVKRVIDTAKRKRPSLAGAAEYVEARKLMRPHALASVYVDTDRLAAIEDPGSMFNGHMQNPLVQLLARKARQILPATKYFVGNLTADDVKTEFSYTLIYDEARMPALLTAMLPRPGAPMDILRLAPRSSVIVLANQMNKAAVWRYAQETIRETNPALANRVSFRARQIGPMIGGMDFETGLLTQIGDQTAVIVAPGDENRLPGIALVIELKDGQVIPMSLRTMAGSIAMIAQVEAEKAGKQPEVELARSTHNGVLFITLKLKQKKLAGKLNPTMFAKDKFMVIATTPEVAKDILDASSAPDPVEQAPPGKTVVARGKINVQALRAILIRYRGFLIRQGVKDGKTEQKARQDLDALAFLLAFVSRVDIRATHSPGRIERSAVFRY